ncbi:unnamed protein product [Gordionus sp. m RMFG-2023]
MKSIPKYILFFVNPDPPLTSLINKTHRTNEYPLTRLSTQFYKYPSSRPRTSVSVSSGLSKITTVKVFGLEKAIRTTSFYGEIIRRKGYG